MSPRLRNTILTSVLLSFSILLVKHALSAEKAAPRIAATNLAYEENIRRFFRGTVSQGESASESETTNNPSGGSTKSRDKSSNINVEVEGRYSYILIGELRKFTADIKGGLIKSGAYRVVEAPLPTHGKDERLFDLVKRIESGEFKIADYVLFGSVTDVQFRDEFTEIAKTNTWTKGISLDMVVEFRLINTKTAEVTASFSAMGSGSSIRLTSNPTERVIPNRAAAVRETAQSLATDVINQLREQTQISK